MKICFVLRQDKRDAIIPHGKFESKFITSPYPGVSACSAEKVNERERKCELQSVLTSPSAMFEVGVDF